MVRRTLSHSPIGFPVSMFPLRLAALALLASFLVPVASAQTGDTLSVTLREAITRALDDSPEVAIEQAGQDFAQARARFARANRFLTQFQVTTGHAVAPGLRNLPENPDFDALYLQPGVRNDWSDIRPYNEIRVEAVQPILTWGELSGSISAAESAVGVEAAEVQGKREEVALRTAELYYGYLLTTELERIAQDTGKTLGSARGELQALLDEGDESVRDADLFQLDIFEQEYLRQRAEVEEQRATVATALRRQLLVPSQAALPVETELQPLAFELGSLDDYFALGLRNRSEMMQAQAGLSAREALVDVARSDFYPKLFLGAEYNGRYAEGRHRQDTPFISDPFLGSGVRAGVGIRQQLNFFQTKAKVEQAEAERNEVAYQREAAEQLVLFEVEEAYRRVRIRQAALEARTKTLEIAGEWLRTEQINFDLELGETRDLIGAARAELESRAGYVQAVRDFNLSVLSLFKAAGVLTNTVATGTLFD